MDENGLPWPRVLGTAQAEVSSSRPSARSTALVRELCQLLETAGLEASVILTTSPGHAAVAAAQSPPALPGGSRNGRSKSSALGTQDRALPAVRQRGDVLVARTNNLETVVDLTDGNAYKPLEGPIVLITTKESAALAKAALSAAGLPYALGPDIARHPTTLRDYTFARKTTVRANRGHRVRLDRRKPEDVLGRALTQREREVLQAFVNGADAADVATLLFVSPKTVKNHLFHIYAKLGVSNRTQAVARALKLGIVTID